MIRDIPKSTSVGGVNYNSIQEAKVKDLADKSYSGRIKVWLVNSNTDENDPANWISLKYSSPMAGVSDPSKMDSQATQDYNSTQTSYGFVGVPAAVDNIVLVAFMNGEPDRGYYIGQTFADTMTSMVPGRPAVKTYDGESLPGGEVNRYSQQTQSPSETPIRPTNTDFADALNSQGLGDDTLLGAGGSGMHRDEIPKVSGWLTPGGNQIILDDKEGSELIRFRTKSGVQLLLSETTGDIFMNTKSGNAAIRISNDGQVDIYSSSGVNFTGAVANIAADSVNLQAGGDLNVKAGGSLNLEGSTVNLKGGTILSSKITGEISYADTAGTAPPGPAVPVGDTAGGAGGVSRTAARGGKSGSSFG